MFALDDVNHDSLSALITILLSFFVGEFGTPLKSMIGDFEKSKSMLMLHSGVNQIIA